MRLRPRAQRLAASLKSARGRPGSGLRPFGSAASTRATLLSRLKYLMACLEEVNRVLGYKLRIEDALRRGYALQELEKEIGLLRERAATTALEPEAAAVLAYGIA